MNPRLNLGFSSAPIALSPPGTGPGEENPYLAIKDPELRLAVMHAHRLWAIKYAPWLLKEWDKS